MNKIEPKADTRASLIAMGQKARQAARALALAPAAVKNLALARMAEAIRHDADIIASENAADLALAKGKALKSSFLDRLTLTPERIAAMAKGLDDIALLPDPVGQVTERWTRPNGLDIARVRVPIGVIGIIYESRPNVTADAGALAMKSGNAAILRGGSDGFRTSAAIVAALQRGLIAAGLPMEAIQMVPTMDRDAVGLLLGGLEGTIDLIVPRGGKSLVARVQQEARVPVFSHLEGICHVYVDRSAKLDMAVRIAVNAKMRRTGVCGAAETLLVDRAVTSTHLVPILEALRVAGCEIHADAEVLKVFFDARPATDADWVTEYLDAIIAVKLVDGVAGAIEHIETFSSHHTEAIIAEDAQVVERFFNEIDSAILLHNASTQFADGGEFGMGAEIGIATGKMHARGPVGVEQLTSFKYRVRGSGQVRP